MSAGGRRGGERRSHSGPYLQSAHFILQSGGSCGDSRPAISAEAIGNYRLVGCDLYVTLEPCTMCAGAIVHSRIQRLIYGATEPKAGAIESASQVLTQSWMNHQVAVTGGVLAEDCSALISAFFRQRRQQIRAMKNKPPILP